MKSDSTLGHGRVTNPATDQRVQKAARRRTSLAAQNEALAAGTHQPAVDDFGNQYLSPVVPDERQAGLRRGERIKETLEWWTRPGPYSVADLQRAYDEGHAEATRTALEDVAERVRALSQSDVGAMYPAGWNSALAAVLALLTKEEGS